MFLFTSLNMAIRKLKIAYITFSLDNAGVDGRIYYKALSPVTGT